MKALGLIAEYNPMHFGHLYHIEKSQALTRPDVTVVVMSGSVVQRGDFAVYDKFHRTQAALKNGVDLVIELPSFYVLQAADYFAHASVFLLDQLGIKDLVFGSETGDLKPLQRLLKSHEDEAFVERLKTASKEGLSYPDAFVKATKDPLSQKALTPNNILGLSYLKALNTMDSSITPHTIKREKRTYYAPLKAFQKMQSATAIRTEIFQDNDVSQYLLEPLATSSSSLTPTRFEAFYALFSYRLNMMQASDFDGQFGFSEGLENRFLKARLEPDYLAFLDAVKTPRYTYAHIHRAMMHVLLHTPTAFKTFKTPPYIRILGLNEMGQKYLNWVKKDLHLPVFTSAKKNQHPLLDFELRISQLIAKAGNDSILKNELSKPVGV